MAGNHITVNTEQVSAIATKIENLNNRLRDELNATKETVDRLSDIWEGEAARETISSYNEFASKYFQNYYDVLEQYVVFLRRDVEQGYTAVETQNKALSDVF